MSLKRGVELVESRILLRELSNHKEFTDFNVRALSFDSRNVEHGDIFFALKGINVNGRDYIAEAKSKGAKLILSEDHIEGSEVIQVNNLRNYMGEVASRFYGEPSRELTTICVTGTNGKTSCVESLAKLAYKSGSNCGYLSTIGVSLDGFDVIRDSVLTTPDSINLQKTFSEILDFGSKFVALEASSHGLEQKRLGGTSVKTAILTSFSHDHLDYHLSIEDYKNAKLSLFRDLNPEISIIQIDNDCGREIYTELLNKDKAVYSVSNKYAADFKYSFTRNSGNRLDMELTSTEGNFSFSLNTLSSVLASNIICSIAALTLNGLNISNLIRNVENLELPKGRMELIKLKNNNYCCIDYAHTPDALESALKELRNSFDGKLWCVFGCGGNRDKLKRPLMGSIAEEYADVIVLTNDNPRSEDENLIFKEILSGVKKPNNILTLADRREAILHSLECADHKNSANIVLVAGKGHETYQQIKDKKLIFDDREVIDKYLSEQNVK